MPTLDGKKIAILVANSGVEQVELTTPRQALLDAGADVVLVAPAKQTIQAFNHDVEPGNTFAADAAVRDVAVDEFDALVLPGGTTNPDQLRIDAEAVEFVADFAQRGKPVAAICHGPWMLVEAGVVRDKTLASWPSLKTDIRNAGGEWRDEQVVLCREAGFALVTSRNPDDLDAFCSAAVDLFAEPPGQGNA